MGAIVKVPALKKKDSKSQLKEETLQPASSVIVASSWNSMKEVQGANVRMAMPKLMEYASRVMIHSVNNAPQHRCVQLVLILLIKIPMGTVLVLKATTLQTDNACNVPLLALPVPRPPTAIPAWRARTPEGTLQTGALA